MTKDEIKARLLATNPSRQYEINGEVFDLTDEEFEKCINDRVEMEFEQIQINEAKEAVKQAALDKLNALGLTEADLKVLGLG